MRSTTLRWTSAALVSAAVSLLTSATDAAPAPTRGPLVLVSFVQKDRTDIRRNEVLEFRFSTLLRKGSVDERTLRVNAVTPVGPVPATGARIVKGNVVRFDPQWTQRGYDEARKTNSIVICPDHPQGLPAFQDFEVQMPAFPATRTLRSVEGRKLERLVTETFRTSASYIDRFPGQPAFGGSFGTGALGFVPPKSGATGLVDEDAVIILEFCEPILIDSLDPSSSVLVTRVATGEQVPGFIQPEPGDRCGTRFWFVPSTGFGSDLVNKTGWDIEVSLTTAITDLAGNPLNRGMTLPVFRTRYVEGKPACSLVVETFADQKKMDLSTVALGGDWNGTEKGVLRAGPATAYPNQDVQYTTASTGTVVVRTQVTDPLVSAGAVGGGCVARPQGSRVQMMYVPADVGAAAAIVGVGWGPSSNALFSARYPEVTLRMGHTSLTALGTDFAGNCNVTSPQLVFKGLYDVPQVRNINPPGLDTGYFDWPALTTPFEWNGVNNLVFDAACQGGNNCQILRIGFVGGGLPFPARRAVGTNWQGNTADLVADPAVYDIRFKKRRRTTQAVSQWYAIGSGSPVFAAPIVSPVAQPAGVSVFLELEGAPAKPDPFDSGAEIADTSRSTGFTPIPSEIDGAHFFRFRLSMYANLVTNQTARVTSIQFPYCSQ